MSIVDVMAKASHGGREARFAKSEARFTPTRNRKKNMALLSVICAARRLWPVKTAHWLAQFAGTTVRSAQLTLAERTEPSGATFANLIRSDAGFEFIRELMDPEFGRAPDWWADVERGARLLELERRAAAARAELDSLRRQIGGDEAT